MLLRRMQRNSMKWDSGELERKDKVFDSSIDLSSLSTASPKIRKRKTEKKIPKAVEETTSVQSSQTNMENTDNGIKESSSFHSSQESCKDEQQLMESPFDEVEG